MNNELKVGDRVRLNLVGPDRQATDKYCLVGKEGWVRHYGISTGEAIVDFGCDFGFVEVHRSRLEKVQVAT